MRVSQIRLYGVVLAHYALPDRIPVLSGGTPYDLLFFWTDFYYTIVKKVSQAEFYSSPNFALYLAMIAFASSN